MRYWSLIRMLYCPLRSPLNTSRRLLGGISRSVTACAASSAARRRKATEAILANSLTRSRWKRRSVFLHRKLRITTRTIPLYTLYVKRTEERRHTARNRAYLAGGKPGTDSEFPANGAGNSCQSPVCDIRGRLPQNG